MTLGGGGDGAAAAAAAGGGGAGAAAVGGDGGGASGSQVRDLLHPVAISSVHPVRIPLPIPATHRQAVRRIASVRLRL